MNWHAHVTVATVVERDGRFLLVEELIGGHRVLNQPAGHLEPEESLLQAAVRETLEETAWTVEIEGVIGVSLYRAPSSGTTYCRTTFHGSPLQWDPDRPLDKGILQALWLTPQELRQEQHRLRSPVVLEVVERYLAGQRYPLSLILT